MDFLTNKWFIITVVILVLLLMIDYLKLYYKIHKKLPWFEQKLKEQKPPPTIRKPVDLDGAGEDKNNDQLKL